MDSDRPILDETDRYQALLLPIASSIIDQAGLVIGTPHTTSQREDWSALTSACLIHDLSSSQSDGQRNDHHVQKQGRCLDNTLRLLLQCHLPCMLGSNVTSDQQSASDQDVVSHD